VSEYLSITEIGGRTKQGATAPFKCTAEDDHHYFVKGKSASALLRLHGEEAVSDLGNEPAFASKRIASSHELRYDRIQHIDETRQQDILLFDAWVRNGDRSLTEKGGNPNLLWRENEVYVIDHNLIFDREFNLNDFLMTHAFHQQMPQILEDSLKRQQYEGKMKQALDNWETAWDALPEEWREENDDLELFDQEHNYQQLHDDANGHIWTRLRQ
jgi:hypothetical protein